LVSIKTFRTEVLLLNDISVFFAVYQFLVRGTIRPNFWRGHPFVLRNYTVKNSQTQHFIVGTVKLPT